MPGQIFNYLGYFMLSFKVFTRQLLFSEHNFKPETLKHF